mmetsp:Transcript_25560/g.59379  ORF Transcript_25560/g.59379 Transcript_25560/m.59379 type:complete len:86 (-) Transcript_25560:21-278(-)
MDAVWQTATWHPEHTHASDTLCMTNAENTSGFGEQSFWLYVETSATKERCSTVIYLASSAGLLGLFIGSPGPLFFVLMGNLSKEN